MSQFHSLHRNHVIKQASGRKSVVYLSKKPNKKVIIFVHGFGGHPIKTWNNFPSILLNNPHTEGFDLIYYNYDSKKVQAPFSGIALSDFMTALVTTPNYFLSSFAGEGQYIRPNDFRYEKIHFVAHSLGSIICRQALNRSYQTGNTWHKMTDMLLFAPAHMGAMILEPILHLFYSTPIAFVADLIHIHTPTMNDVNMKLDDCSTKKLINDTIKIQDAESDSSFTVAKKVVHAENDIIVNSQRFLRDPEAVPAYGEDHGSVCKPNWPYMEPVNLVLKYIA